MLLLQRETGMRTDGDVGVPSLQVMDKTLEGFPARRTWIFPVKSAERSPAESQGHRDGTGEDLKELFGERGAETAWRPGLAIRAVLTAGRWPNLA